MFGDELPDDLSSAHRYHVVFMTTDAENPTRTFSVSSATVTLDAPLYASAMIERVRDALMDKYGSPSVVLLNWIPLEVA
jgi:hypothetical protein